MQEMDTDATTSTQRSVTVFQLPHIDEHSFGRYPYDDSVDSLSDAESNTLTATSSDVQHILDLVVGEDGFGHETLVRVGRDLETVVPTFEENTASSINLPDAHRRGSKLRVELPRSTLSQPRSHYEGFVPPSAVVRELEAIDVFLEAMGSSSSSEEDYIEFDLNQFAIYTDQQTWLNDMQPLQHLATRQKGDWFYFDGLVSSGEAKFYLRRIPFRQLPIGNYGSSEHTVGNQIWIRSEKNEKKEIYYKLGSPSLEYERYHRPFLWIADLAKHVIDYCEYVDSNRGRATLDDFKSRFSNWLQRKHAISAAFRDWYHSNRGNDFRGAIVANVDYIWKEAYGVDPKITSRHQLWREIKHFNQYKLNLSLCNPSDDDDDEEEPHQRPFEIGGYPRTVVTPYVNDLFSHMNFSNFLDQVEPSPSVKKKQSLFIQSTRPTSKAYLNSSCQSHLGQSHLRLDRKTLLASIQPGDVISTKPDDDTTDTQWKHEYSKHHESEHLWFGLIQKVHHSAKGKRSFDVVWLYQPIDTPCGMMKYPWNNELFLSNNCTCHHGTAKVHESEILSKHQVEWFGDPSTDAEYFIRQTYVAEDCRWMTLRENHLKCGWYDTADCSQDNYSVGDAVLVETEPESLRLDPFIIESLFEESRLCIVRRLKRRKDVDPQARNSPINELVWSKETTQVSFKRIMRRCLIRAFRHDEDIPCPYNRGGNGNAFFITHQEVPGESGGSNYVPLEASQLEPLQQTFHPMHTPNSQKLRGLDLFCGGGNFGRGLEDGNGVEIHWANDISCEAMHTYMANSSRDKCTPLLGSVDDLLYRALRGDRNVPQPGDAQLIAGGSPCPGFSMLTANKTTDKQRKNQSLVASFASFIDLYRPYYGLLENVPAMVNSKAFRDTCVFSQLVCAIVGLGYQVQIMKLDAWSFGAPQSRSRVFLSFTTAGFRMPAVPRPSHSHPPGTPLHRFGLTSCGLPFDKREIVATPFKFVSAKEVTEDLPTIQDGMPDYCVGWPDHRFSFGHTAPIRKSLRLIPIQPFGMTFSKAYHTPDPVITESERGLFHPAGVHRVKKGSKGWGRIRPNNLFPTIACRVGPTDARVGSVNHWQEHRPITILEARRAQGYPDHEVVLGLPGSQFRIVGNSVSRQVAMALGLEIRKAWFGTLLDEGPTTLPRPTWLVHEKEQHIPTAPIMNPDYLDEDRQQRIGPNETYARNTKEPSSSCTEPSEERTAIPTPRTSPDTPASTIQSGGAFETSRKRRPDFVVEVLIKRARLNIDDVEW